MRRLLAALTAWLEAQARLADARAAELNRAPPGTRPILGRGAVASVGDPVVVDPVVGGSGGMKVRA